MNGSNAKKYNDDQLFEMQIDNYRRIEKKLEKGFYLMFKEKDIHELSKCLNKFNLNLAKVGNLNIEKLAKNELEKVLDYLYNMKKSFFVNQELCVGPSELKKESFFELELDSSIILRRGISYCNNYEVIEDYDVEMSEKLRKVGKHPDQLLNSNNNNN